MRPCRRPLKPMTGSEVEAGATNDEPATHEVAQLKLWLTDAPLDADAVWVTISEIQVHACLDEAVADEGTTDETTDNSTADSSTADDEAADPAGTTDETSDGEPSCSNGTWRTVRQDAITFDLLSLQGGVTQVLGVAELPVGSYGPIRLKVAEAEIELDGERFPLKIPSGPQTGIKLIGGFELEPGMQTELLLDFDAQKSIHHNRGQGWMMKPVIHVISERIEVLEPPQTDESTQTDEETDSDGQTDTMPNEPVYGDTSDWPIAG